MSESPEKKKHPWAKYRATANVSRQPKESGRPAVLPLGTRPPFAPLVAGGPVPKAITKPAQPREKTAPVVSAPVAEKKPAAKVHRHTEDKAPKTPPKAPPKEKAPPKSSVKPAVEKKPAAPVAPVPVSAEMATVLSELEKANLDPAVVRRVQPEVHREKGWRRVLWLWNSLKDSVQNHRKRRRSFNEWWRVWRTGSSARVLLAFVVIYGLLGLIRKPSDVVVERSRIGEEMAFLNGFLKSYCSNRGQVLATKPHGGAEIYPRGVVLKAEMLDAFQRADEGEVFSVHVTYPMWNPLEGFYGFMPIYAGGTYFHLDRKFNFALYRASFLIRKDSEEAGTVLLALVERAH